VCPGTKTSTHYFLWSGGPGANHKKCPETRYAKLLFLHELRFLGHVVRFGASGMQKVDKLFFDAWVGPVWIAQKVRWDMLR
jgi:hypothetical protein